MVSNKLLTLAFVREPTRILLGMKKRGFGQGRWNGFGGKVQPGEAIEDAAKRELQEECNLVATSLEKIGVLMFQFLGDPQLMEVHVFHTTKYTGTMQESDEMRPEWYNLDNIPFPKMWPDDHMWFPYMLRDQCFYGYFTFQGMDIIVDQTLHAVKDVSEITIPKEPQYKPNVAPNGETISMMK